MKKLEDKQLDRGREIVFIYNEITYRGRVPTKGEMSPGEVRDFLTRIPGNFAYWARVRNSILRDLRARAVSYDLWKSQKMQKVNDSHPRWSAGAKEAEVLTLYASEYKKIKKVISDLQYAADQAEVMVKSLEMLHRGMQSAGSLLKSEMENLG